MGTGSDIQGRYARREGCCSRRGGASVVLVVSWCCRSCWFVCGGREYPRGGVCRGGGAVEG